MRIFVSLLASVALAGCATPHDSGEQTDEITGAPDLALPTKERLRTVPTHEPPPPEALGPARPPDPDPEPPRILDRSAADRLMNNSGITLQWIGWERRGEVDVTEDTSGVWRLNGAQADGQGGLVSVQGAVTEIGADYFILSGRIAITDTPDIGRNCVAERRDWRFAVTQNRKYWRLREFEWCDGLTDYIDIYF